MLGILFHRRGAAQHRARVLQFAGIVGGAADLAVVAVLVGGAAARAAALDETVRQEHLLFRVEELADGALADVAGVAQFPVDVLGQVAVFVRVRAVVVVEADLEAGEVGLVLPGHARDQLLRRDAVLPGAQHDGRAVGIVGADVDTVVAAQLLEAHPDIGLDVLHQVPDVDRAVGVGQGAGDQQGADFLTHARVSVGVHKTVVNGRVSMP